MDQIDSALETERRAIADGIFEGYAFDGNHVVAVNGWEWMSGSATWSRCVFFAYDELQGDATRGQFTVVFEESTARVVDAYGLIEGEIVGKSGDDMRSNSSAAAPAR